MHRELSGSLAVLETAAAAASRAPSAPSVGVVFGLDGLNALEAEWRTLFETSRNDNYFVSFDWCKSWLDAFGTKAGARPIVFCVRRQDRLVAILPLVNRRFGPMSTAHCVGAVSGQYGDLLIERDRGTWEEIFPVLWDGIVASGIDLIQFANVRDDSPLAAFIGTRRSIQSDPLLCCALDTSRFESFATYIETRSSSLKKNLRKRRRKLESVAPLVYEVVRDPMAIDEVTNTIIRHKLDWLDDRGTHGRFLSRVGVAAWLADVARRALATGNLHLSLLRLGDRIISAQLAFISGNRFTAYLSSFDIAYGAYGVGRMQYASFMEDVFDRKLQIDLMPRHDEFKLEWVEHGAATRGYAVPVTRRGSALSLVQNPRTRAVARNVVNFLYTHLVSPSRSSRQEEVAPKD